MHVSGRRSFMQNEVEREKTWIKMLFLRSVLLFIRKNECKILYSAAYRVKHKNTNTANSLFTIVNLFFIISTCL